MRLRMVNIDSIWTFLRSSMPLVLGLFSFTALAQPVAQWDRSYGGNLWEECFTAKQTQDGGFLLGGLTTSTPSGQVSEATFDTFLGNSTGDYWVVKTDEDGAVEWDRRYGSDSQDRLWAVQQTADGGYILGGTSRSTTNMIKSDSLRGEMDYWVIKVDALGNPEWDQTYGGDSLDQLADVIELSGGGYAIIGSSYSDSIYDKSQDSRGFQDAWIIRTDGQGEMLWDQTIGGDGEDQVNVIQEAADGHLLIGGSTASDISGEIIAPSQGGKDFWFMKLDVQTGDILWQWRYGGDNEDEIISFDQTADGGYILSGGSRSDATGDKTDMARGVVDFWVVKVDAAGGIEWDRTFGGPLLENCYSVKQNSIGYYLLGGFSMSNAGGDKTEDSQGAFDFWLLYLDQDGNKIWDKTLGGSSNDVMQNVFQTNDGGYLMAGHSMSLPSGDKQSDNQGLNDFWVIKTRCDLSVDLRDTVICPGDTITLSAYDPTCLDCRYIWSDGSQDSIRRVMPTQETSYAVTLVDGVGCSRSDAIRVEIYQPPQVNLGDDRGACPNVPVALDAGFPSFDHEWSTGEVVQGILAFTEGSYTVTVTDDRGCTGTDEIEIFYYTAPEVELGVDVRICANDPITFDATTANISDYEWSSGETTPEITTNLVGNYIVTITDANSCTDSDTIAVLEAYSTVEVLNLATSCDVDNQFYSIQFDLTNGDPDTYEVTGMPGTISGTLFISNPIPRGETYQFFVDDVNGCGPTVVEGSYDCACISDAGVLNPPVLGICGNESFPLQFALAPSLDANDQLEFVLHDGDANTIGTILRIFSGTEISYDPSLAYNTTYFITPRVGNSLGTGVNLADGCLSIGEGVPISFLPEPQASIEIIGAQSLDCFQPTSVLSGNASQGEGPLAYAWETSNGKFLTPENQMVVEIDGGGVYILQVTDQNNGCLDTAAVNLSQSFDLPQIDLIESPQPITCIDSTATFSVNVLPMAPSTEIFWRGGALEGQSDPQGVVNAPGIYEVVAVRQDNGCRDSLQVTVSEDTIPPVVSAGGYTHIDCDSDEATLQGSIQADAPTTFFWTSTDGVILSDPNQLELSVGSLGRYQLTAVHSRNGCVGIDELLVTEDPDAPKGLRVSLRPPRCNGESNGMILVDSIYGANAPFVLSVNEGPFINAAIVDNLSGGFYDLTIEDVFGCRYDTTIFMTVPDVLQLELGGNQVLQLGDSITIRPEITEPISSFEWSLNPFILNPDQLDATIKPTETAFYQLEVVSETGCTVQEGITIGIEKRRNVFVPTAFSPDVDGFNDYFTLYGDASVLNIEFLRIFDRWGVAVFHGENLTPNDPLQGWDGFLRGRAMPIGVYTWAAKIVYVDGVVEIVEGDVTLLR